MINELNYKGHLQLINNYLCFNYNFLFLRDRSNYLLLEYCHFIVCGGFLEHNSGRRILAVIHPASKDSGALLLYFGKWIWSEQLDCLLTLN